ncbi:MAG: hypothetical protein ACRCZ2_06675 [Fusobacteriaceae bacterium]
MFKNHLKKYFFYEEETGNNGSGGIIETNIEVDGVGEIDITKQEGGIGVQEDSEQSKTDEETKPFNPLDMDFEESELEEKVNLKFGDYNLEKYKDVIKFDDPKVAEAFSLMSEQYKEQGFTQNQIEFLIDREIENVKNKKSTQVTADELKSKLDIKTKREWKNLTGDLNEIFGTVNSEYAKHLQAFASNPVQMNIFRGISEFYKNKYSGGIGDTLKQRDPIPKSTGQYSATGAVEKLNAALRSRNYGEHQDMYSYAEHLLSNVKESEKEAAMKFLGSYIKKK